MKIMKHFYLRGGILTAVAVTACGLFATGILLGTPLVRAALAAKDTTGAHASITADTHTITVRELGGYVAVYRDEAFAQMTDIPVSSLPAGDRKALSRGISVADDMALHQLLEDLGA